MKESTRHFLKVTIIALIVGSLAMLLFFAVLKLCFGRDDTSLPIFTPSEEYRWECQEIDMFVIYHENAYYEAGIKLGETSYSLNVGTRGHRIEFELLSGTGTNRKSLYLILNAEKTEDNKITFKVLSDDFNLAPENGILTFVKVPINPAK